MFFGKICLGFSLWLTDPLSVYVLIKHNDWAIGKRCSAKLTKDNLLASFLKLTQLQSDFFHNCNIDSCHNWHIGKVKYKRSQSDIFSQ